MGLVTSPYLDRQDAAREIERGAQLARAHLNGDRAGKRRRASTREAGARVSQDVAVPGVLTSRRTRECLLFLVQHPGSSNREIAAGIGVRYQAQISQLLARLADQSLAAKRSEGAGKRNAWRLTPHGEETALSIQRNSGHSSTGSVQRLNDAVTVHGSGKMSA